VENLDLLETWDWLDQVEGDTLVHPKFQLLNSQVHLLVVVVVEDTVDQLDQLVEK